MSSKKKATFKPGILDKKTVSRKDAKQTGIDLSFIATTVGQMHEDHKALLRDYNKLLDDHKALVEVIKALGTAHNNLATFLNTYTARNTSIHELLEMRITVLMRVLNAFRVSEDLDKDLPLIETEDKSPLFGPPEQFIGEYAALIGWQGIVGFARELENQRVQQEIAKKIREQHAIEVKNQKGEVHTQGDIISTQAPTPTTPSLIRTDKQESTGYTEFAYKPNATGEGLIL